MSNTVRYLKAFALVVDRGVHGRHLHDTDPNSPPAPSIFRLVLENSYPWPKLEPWPPSRRMLPRRCFSNAAALVLEEPRRYSYCEGYASDLVTTTHAWVYDRHLGAILDPTWRLDMQHGVAEYVGMRFRTSYLREYLRTHKNVPGFLENPRWVRAAITRPTLLRRALVPHKAQGGPSGEVAA